MADQLAQTTLDFLRELDRITVSPSESEVRHLARLAAWLACQRSNPLFDHDFIDIFLWDLADSVLWWLAAPADKERLAAMGVARGNFTEACERQAL